MRIKYPRVKGGLEVLRRALDRGYYSISSVSRIPLVSRVYVHRQDLDDVTRNVWSVLNDRACDDDVDRVADRCRWIGAISWPRCPGATAEIVGRISITLE